MLISNNSWKIRFDKVTGQMKEDKKYSMGIYYDNIVMYRYTTYSIRYYSTFFLVLCSKVVRNKSLNDKIIQITV